MKKLYFLSSILVSIAFNAQVTYGFETSQNYNLGALSGQNGWGGTDTSVIGVVSADRGNAGTQSFKLTGTNQQLDVVRGEISPTFSVAANIVTVSFNAYFGSAPNAGDECDYFFSSQSPTESTINSRLRFTYLNEIVVIDDDGTGTLAYIDTGFTFTRNVWHTYKMNLDFSKQLVEYFQDGVSIYTGKLIGGTFVGNLAITSDDYNSSAYFDDIKVFNATLGTSESKKEAFTVYPNPTSDFLNIKSADKISSVQIFDSAGKSLSTANFKNNQIDVRNLPKGIYLIKIDSDKGTVNQKFIKK